MAAGGGVWGVGAEGDGACLLVPESTGCESVDGGEVVGRSSRGEHLRGRGGGAGCGHMRENLGGLLRSFASGVNHLRQAGAKLAVMIDAHFGSRGIFRAEGLVGKIRKAGGGLVGGEGPALHFMKNVQDELGCHAFWER